MTHNRPNIIFILTDDLGYGDIGVFHQNSRGSSTNGDSLSPAHHTPHLDRMAAEGMQLRRHYTAAPVCAPARASLLLGVHQGHANVRNNQFDKALEDNHTLGSILQTAGYATAAIGKWGLQGEPDPEPPSWPAHPLNRGFDYYLGYIHHVDGHEHYPKEGIHRGKKEVWENHNEISNALDGCYTTDLFAARSKKWITDHHNKNPDQPFFLYLAFDTPHAVLAYPAKAYPQGGGLNGGIQWLDTPGNMINTADGTPDSYCHPDYADKDWPDVYKRYASSIRRIDDATGDILQLLKDLHIDDNTLVIFTSDNGASDESYIEETFLPTFFASNGPYEGQKRDLWEGGIRVGALARWPGHIPEGAINNRANAFWDWMPTFTALAGLPIPARSDGVSLLPSLLAAGEQPPSTIYIEYYHGQQTPDYPEFAAHRRGRLRRQMQAIAIGDYMGVRYNITSAGDLFEIYDVATDPHQIHNLADKPAFSGLQTELQQRALRTRVADPSAQRPYDNAPIPAAIPLSAGSAAHTLHSVQWQRYDISSPWCIRPENTLPHSTGTQPGFELSMVDPDQDCQVRFSGYLHIPEDGEYTLSVTTATGALLSLHNATLIDADYISKTGTQTVRLQKGYHPFNLHYRHQKGDLPKLVFKYTPTLQ